MAGSLLWADTKIWWITLFGLGWVLSYYREDLLGNRKERRGRRLRKERGRRWWPTYLVSIPPTHTQRQKAFEVMHHVTHISLPITHDSWIVSATVHTQYTCAISYTTAGVDFKDSCEHWHHMTPLEWYWLQHMTCECTLTWLVTMYTVLNSN